MLKRLVVLGLGLIALDFRAAVAEPTPVPGGANQISAISADLGHTVFNGVLRIKITDLREATAAEANEYLNLAGGDKKGMAFTALLRNGAKDDFIDLLQYTLADKDDIAVSVGGPSLHPGNLHIVQGAAARQTVIFTVDKDFTPVKLIVQCATCGAHSAFRSVRFSVSQ